MILFKKPAPRELLEPISIDGYVDAYEQPVTIYPNEAGDIVLCAHKHVRWGPLRELYFCIRIQCEDCGRECDHMGWQGKYDPGCGSLEGLAKTLDFHTIPYGTREWPDWVTRLLHSRPSSTLGARYAD